MRKQKIRNINLERAVIKLNSSPTVILNFGPITTKQRQQKIKGNKWSMNSNITNSSLSVSKHRRGENNQK